MAKLQVKICWCFHSGFFFYLLPELVVNSEAVGKQHACVFLCVFRIILNWINHRFSRRVILTSFSYFVIWTLVVNKENYLMNQAYICVCVYFNEMIHGQEISAS